MGRPTTVRPGGKIYRPIKAPALIEYGDHFHSELPAVTRTHDLDVATALLRRFSYDVDEYEHELTWWRYVPWDDSGMYDSSYVYDDVRGTPVVRFYPKEDLGGA